MMHGHMNLKFVIDIIVTVLLAENITM